MILQSTLKKSYNRFSRIFLVNIAVLSLIFFATNSFARNVSFDWNANTDSTPVDGYKLYYKVGDPSANLSDYKAANAAGYYQSPIKINGKDNLSYSIPNLLDSQKYSFVLTSFRGSAESIPTSALVLGVYNKPPTPSLILIEEVN